MLKIFNFYLFVCLFTFLSIFTQKSWTAGLKDSVKSEVYKRIITEREVYVQANLKSLKGDEKEYRFDALMAVNSSIKKTREIMTQYSLYTQLIPYVQKSDYDSKSKILSLEGGIFGFVLKSALKFNETKEQNLTYQIIAGHLTGLKGEFNFEELEPGKTLVGFNGNLMGEKFPPAIIMERGAEVVYTITGRKMRDRIEDPLASINRKDSNNDVIPKPQRYKREN